MLLYKQALNQVPVRKPCGERVKSWVEVLLTRVWPCQGPQCFRPMRMVRPSPDQIWMLTLCVEISSTSCLVLEDCSLHLLPYRGS